MKRVVFIQTMPFEILGIQLLAAAVKPNQSMVIITYIDSFKNILKKLHSYKPDCICFTSCTADHNVLIELAGKLKKHFDIPYIWGGPHPTFFPEIIKEEGIDVVVRGEAEHVIPKLIENLDNKSIKSCWFKDKDGKITKNPIDRLLSDLDTLPFPDYGLYKRSYKLLPYSSMNIVTGRGCPYNCSFCYNQTLKKLHNEDVKTGNYIRRMTPKRVIEEIKHFIAVRKKPKCVRFWDDTFLTNKKWVLEFLDLYRKEIKIPWTCLARGDQVDEELAKKLKASNIAMIYWAIESGSERLRNKICNKRTPNETIIKCGEILNRHKIPFRTFNMTGLPTETFEDAMLTVKLNQEVGNKYPVSSIYDPYPGTEMAEFVAENNLAKEELSSDSHFKNMYEGSILKIDPRIVRLNQLFFYFVRFPRLNGFLRWWVRKDHVAINNLLFYVPYTYVFCKTYKYTISEMAIIVMRIFKPMVDFRKAQKS